MWQPLKCRGMMRKNQNEGRFVMTKKISVKLRNGRVVFMSEWLYRAALNFVDVDGAFYPIEVVK